jgi:glycosyltransferase involved in cell wall biosynthesis
MELAQAAQRAGWNVSIATRAVVAGGTERIRRAGFNLFPLETLRRTSRQPLSELSAVLELARLYRRIRPDVVHHVAMKPVLYGSLAARLARVPAIVNAFAGLGYAFIGEARRTRLLRRAIEIGLRAAIGGGHTHVIFQNEDDSEMFVRAGVVRREQVVIIRGAGVNLAEFSLQPEPQGECVVLLASRMLWDKGVGEFVKAARILKEQGRAVRFVLAGMVDEGNPAHITERQLVEWRDEGVVEWSGHSERMPDVLAAAHIVVLPSYREGLPKVLLEAAATGRATVATDVPGCREIVRHEENGLLVPPRDATALARAIEILLDDAPLRRRLGARGREIVEAEFSSEQVARETLALYDGLLGKNAKQVAPAREPVR